MLLCILQLHPSWRWLNFYSLMAQDPLENYFGQQRACGGWNENPNLQQCLHNAAAIRVQKSMATDPVRGNCSRKRRLYVETKPDINATPLPKRKRHKTLYYDEYIESSQLLLYFKGVFMTSH